MTADVKRVLFTDTLYVQDAVKGNWDAIQRRQDAAVAAALKGDIEALRATGINESTQNMFLKWAKESPEKLTKQVSGLNDLYRQFMGSGMGPSSGTGLSATKNALAGLFQLQETKRIAEFHEAQRKMVGENEGSRRRAVDGDIPKIAELMQSDAFKDLHGAWGSAATDAARLIDEYNRGVVGAASKVKMMIADARKYQDMWVRTDRKDLFGPPNAYAQHFNILFDNASRVETANMESDQADFLAGVVRELEGPIMLNAKKVDKKDS
jgi:hypothetical protein